VDDDPVTPSEWLRDVLREVVECPHDEARRFGVDRIAVAVSPPLR
jgi:hypothetical protein